MVFCRSPPREYNGNSGTEISTHSIILLHELRQALKGLTIYQQLCSFLLLCKILYHCKSLPPSKSMPQRSDHNLKEKYPFIRAGTLETILIKDILTKNRFLPYASVLEYE